LYYVQGGGPGRPATGHLVPDGGQKAPNRVSVDDCAFSATSDRVYHWRPQMLFSWCTTFAVSVDEKAWIAEVQSAWEGWENLSPEVTFDDVYEGQCPKEVPAGWLPVTVDDAASTSTESGELTFGDDISWGFPDEVNDPSCTELMSIGTLAAHGIGHFLGLGHTCDEGEVCVGSDTLLAVMYWSLGICEEKDLNDADRALLDEKFLDAGDTGTTGDSGDDGVMDTSDGGSEDGDDGGGDDDKGGRGCQYGSAGSRSAGLLSVLGIMECVRRRIRIEPRDEIVVRRAERP
jgi:hypothetical protein